jgi:hypothetical protein
MKEHSGQYSLFGPDLNPEKGVKVALNKAAKASPLSRDQVCDRLEELAQEHGLKLANGNARRLRRETLEKWLNPAESQHVPPLRALVLLCKVLGTSAPLAALAAPLGLAVITEEQQRLLKRAEIDDEIARLRRQRKRLEE